MEKQESEKSEGNKIDKLRDVLFEQLERLNTVKMLEDRYCDNEIRRANALVQVSNAITGTVKAELMYMRATKEKGGELIKRGEPKKLGNAK